VRGTQYTRKRSLLHRQQGLSLLARPIERAQKTVNLSDIASQDAQATPMPERAIRLSAISYQLSVMSSRSDFVRVELPELPGDQDAGRVRGVLWRWCHPVEARARSNFLNFLNVRRTSESTGQLTALPTPDSPRIVAAEEIAGAAEPGLVAEILQAEGAEGGAQVVLDRVLAQVVAVADLRDGQAPSSQLDDLTLPPGQRRQRRGEGRVVRCGRERTVATVGPFAGSEPALVDVGGG
jgi:hypothetical protein